jgi:hypothetical protein
MAAMQNVRQLDAGRWQVKQPTITRQIQISRVLLQFTAKFVSGNVRVRAIRDSCDVKCSKWQKASLDTYNGVCGTIYHRGLACRSAPSRGLPVSDLNSDVVKFLQRETSLALPVVSHTERNSRRRPHLRRD